MKVKDLGKLVSIGDIQVGPGTETRVGGVNPQKAHVYCTLT